MRRVLVAAFALSLSSAPGGAADLAEVKTRGTLRVIAAADEAPETFSFTAGPSPGFDRELIEGFSTLRQALDEYLTNFRHGPSWSRLIVKYFGDQALRVLGRER